MEVISNLSTLLLILLGIVAAGLAFSEKYRDSAIWVGFAAGVFGCLWFCSWLQDKYWKDDVLSAEEQKHGSTENDFLVKSIAENTKPYTGKIIPGNEPTPKYPAEFDAEIERIKDKPYFLFFLGHGKTGAFITSEFPQKLIKQRVLSALER